ncbi:MAG: response regulator transcription factor [Armatimonadota bacterium]
MIDKYPIINWAIREYLSQHNRFSVLGFAASADEAMASIKLKKPDVVVGTPQITLKNLEAITNIVRLGAQVIAYCDVMTKDMIEAFWDAGGLGVVTILSPLDDLEKAIESVACGKKWIAPSLRASFTIESDQEEASLTNREREIVALVAQGLSSRVIADRLFISVNTVESHRKRIFKKLNVHTCAQLVRYAVKEKLILEPR